MKTTLSSLFAAMLLTIAIPDCRLPSDPAVAEVANGICGELAASRYVPTALAKVLCVAKDSVGTLYVVDKENSTIRCFISAHDTLQRHQVLGSSIIGEKYFFLSITGGSQLIFENFNGVCGKAYYCSTGRCEKCDSILQSAIGYPSKNISDLDTGWSGVCAYLDQNRDLNCPALITAKVTDLNNYRIRNFPPATHIEYLASQPDDNYLLVTRAEYDWEGDVVVHYGKSGELKLRTTTRFVRASDGGSTWIRFMIGSTEAEAYFGVKWDSVGVHAGETWLAMNHDTISIDRITPNTDTLKMLGIDCDHEIRLPYPYALR